jgi:hypothetical protein
VDKSHGTSHPRTKRFNRTCRRQQELRAEVEVSEVYGLRSSSVSEKPRNWQYTRSVCSPGLFWLLLRCNLWDGLREAFLAFVHDAPLPRRSGVTRGTQGGPQAKLCLRCEASSLRCCLCSIASCLHPCDGASERAMHQISVRYGHVDIVIWKILHCSGVCILSFFIFAS